MSFIQDEIILPSSVISIIIGYQLAVFFLYQYLKMKDENIELNKILLAYALFFGFAMSGALFRILVNYFFHNNSINLLLIRLSFIFFILSIDSFLLITSKKPFHQVFRPLIPRLIVLLTMIPLILVLMYYSFFELIITYIMLVALMGFIYIIIFQYKLKDLSTGVIKKRLTLILIGEIILLVGFLMGTRELRTLITENGEIILLISMPIVISSLLIIYFGVYEFPAFLEFDWKKRIIHCFVVKENPIEEIYSFDFKTVLNNSEKQRFTDIMSRVIIGIEDIVSEITHVKDVKTNIIKKGDMTIMLEYSSEFPNPLIYVLVVRGEKIESLKYFLKMVKEQFQGFFKEILLKLNEFKGEEKKLFTSFNIIMKNLIQ